MHHYTLHEFYGEVESDQYLIDESLELNEFGHGFPE